MDWIEFAGAGIAAFALAATWLATRGHGQAESENLALVRRRRALRDELQRVVPDDLEARQLVQAAARRLGVSGSSLEALEAAIERGSRLSDSQYLSVN